MTTTAPVLRGAIHNLLTGQSDHLLSLQERQSDVAPGSSDCTCPCGSNDVRTTTRCNTPEAPEPHVLTFTLDVICPVVLFLYTLHLFTPSIVAYRVYPRSPSLSVSSVLFIPPRISALILPSRNTILIESLLVIRFCSFQPSLAEFGHTTATESTLSPSC